MRLMLSGQDHNIATRYIVSQIFHFEDYSQIFSRRLVREKILSYIISPRTTLPLDHYDTIQV